MNNKSLRALLEKVIFDAFKDSLTPTREDSFDRRDWEELKDFSGVHWTQVCEGAVGANPDVLPLFKEKALEHYFPVYFIYVLNNKSAFETLMVASLITIFDLSKNRKVQSMASRMTQERVMIVGAFFEFLCVMLKDMGETDLLKGASKTARSWNGKAEKGVLPCA